ncbi:valyl-tRNA synthetase [Ruminococcus sp. YE71]|uniref:valine--tRNA ligase n=1 Tax=unclassified Ruminococcus TaxID=2608920 RepID=UPI0008850D59|nr:MULTISPECIES: valine--tRNA ligase [unclassified Ruminococcus]SDA18209.1 valyl-tRNA synthetase [Ruminococcus sp. YE78]SFW30287.1 valyl-tRNA synthetase [Ruminococcus sp. YE71]
MKRELEKLYKPSDFEDRIYDMWVENRCFHAEIDHEKIPYTIVIPPPNITGQLHMGHALDNTLQDILIRWKRMSGYCTLWLPGTDHASIATEAKIVEAMRKEGITKDDIGRDKFLERAWDWKKQYGGRIVSQLKKLGSSCDWERERFTMDEGCSKAVKEVFISYYEKGLIYRGERIINWCPHCLTSISNAEVNYENQAGSFWHLRYPLKDGSGYVELATTRPETLLGDTAVAVNPKDERYKDIVGKTLILPLVGREIPVVADNYVAMDFGTGVVKITPAHDPNDFEVGRRHDLPVINVLTEDAKIVDDYPAYAGMDRYEARKKIVADLEAGGFLVKIEEHEHNVGTCYRCGTTVEPRVSLQWFVKMEELAKPAIKAVEDGKIRFVPDRFSKNYFNWMNDIRDWCISRQLWWGHRIPAFYCDDCGEMVVTKESSAVCPKCGKPMRQDPDTLDTWFSSALWPFSTLGWPDKTEELDYFYPTNTLVTGYDIITFWVSRMIVAGMEYMKEKPFETVLIHGLVRDEQGRKMSKSLGNGIDPLEVIANYGADALRFMLATGNAPGNDMRYMDSKVVASRNFANKLWNAARFIMMNLPDDFTADTLPEDMSVEDKWIVSKFNTLCKEIDTNLTSFELGVAVAKLYDFIWDVYCDWYIELTKPRIAAGGDTAKSAQTVLVWVMKGMLKLLHPFMPYITEEIWQVLTDGASILMLEKYPTFDESLSFAQEEADFGKIIAAIKAVRNIRSEMNVAPSVKAKLAIETAEKDVFAKGEIFFERLASASSIEIADKIELPDSVTVVTDAARIFIPLSDIVDSDKERERLNKEKQKVQKDIDFLSGKLSNQGFLAKAPEQLINAQKEKLAKAQEKMAKIEQSLAALK